VLLHEAHAEIVHQPRAEHVGVAERDLRVAETARRVVVGLG
jgi:hypothetical protein